MKPEPYSGKSPRQHAGAYCSTCGGNVMRVLSDSKYRMYDVKCLQCGRTGPARIAPLPFIIQRQRNYY